MRKRNNEQKALKTLIELFFIFTIIFLLVVILKNTLEGSEKQEFKSSASKVKMILTGKTTEEDRVLKVEKGSNFLEDGKEIKDINQRLNHLKEAKIDGVKEENFNSNDILGKKGRHYFNQLDIDAKKMYEKLKNESAYFIEGQHTFDFAYTFDETLQKQGGEEKLKQSFQLAINALTFDYPELYFLDIEKLVLIIEMNRYKNGTKLYKVKISNKEGQTFFLKGINGKKDAIDGIQKIEAKVQEIIKRTNGMKQEEKIRYVHDYIVDNIEYDVNKRGKHIYNVYGALVKNSAVCEGYAKSFQLIMDKMGIPTIIVAGQGKSNGHIERHAWNMVKLDGKWYGIDTTWDDPVTSHEIAKVRHRYKYYLKGKTVFGADHIPDGNLVEKAVFKYPELNRYDYY